jgi:hypothetical protein
MTNDEDCKALCYFEQGNNICPLRSETHPVPTPTQVPSVTPVETPDPKPSSNQVQIYINGLYRCSQDHASSHNTMSRADAKNIA